MCPRHDVFDLGVPASRPEAGPAASQAVSVAAPPAHARAACKIGACARTGGGWCKGRGLPRRTSSPPPLSLSLPLSLPPSLASQSVFSLSHSLCSLLFSLPLRILLLYLSSLHLFFLSRLLSLSPCSLQSAIGDDHALTNNLMHCPQYHIRPVQATPTPLTHQNCERQGHAHTVDSLSKPARRRSAAACSFASFSAPSWPPNFRYEKVFDGQGAAETK